MVCKGSVRDGGKAIHEALQTTQTIGTHHGDVWHVWHLEGPVQAVEERGRAIERQTQHWATTGKQVRLALPALLHFAQALEATQHEALAQLGEWAVGLIGGCGGVGRFWASGPNTCWRP